MRYFLDRDLDKVLEIVTQINNKNKYYSVREISQIAGISRTLAIKNIEVINQYSFSNKKNFSLRRKNSIVTELMINNYPVEELASELLSRSTLNTMIRYLFINKRIIVKEYCKKFSISTSTFSRKRKKLKEFLEKINLGLTRRNEISGKETLIREFFLIYFKNSSTNYPLSKSSFNEMSLIFSGVIPNWEERTSSNKELHCLILTISLNRCSQGQFISEDFYTNLYEGFFDNIVVNKIYKNYIKKGYNIKQSKIETGMVVYLLFKEGLIFDSYTSTKVVTILYNKEGIREQSNGIKNLLKQNLSFFSIYEKEDVNHYLLSRIVLFNYVIKDFYIPYDYFYYIYNRKDFYNFDKTEMEILKEINSFVRKILLKSQYSEYYKDFLTHYSKRDLVYYLFITVYSVLMKTKAYEIPPVKIFIDHSKLLNTEIIASKLKMIFSDSITIANSNYKEVDLFITDSNTIIGVDKKVVTIDSYAEKDDLQIVLDSILKIRE
ncbi:helix-turn-helix domain-containing protein [Enterococcus gilvus]|uniref:helix-turn-helix domain-containing protein n=1 Tax=Enterococcus gilvus TaxID=160453 RepID=UPI0028D82FFC|nr:helix-turn-helix domain-containing protein [Enterococcus gilvus]